MEYTLTITSDNAAELAALLSGISGGSAVKGPVKKLAAASNSTSDNTDTPTDEGVVSNNGGEKITKEALRELTTEKAQADAGNPAKIKAILKKLGGATQVANLAEEHYASYHKQVSAL